MIEKIGKPMVKFLLLVGCFVTQNYTALACDLPYIEPSPQPPNTELLPGEEADAFKARTGHLVAEHQLQLDLYNTRIAAKDANQKAEWIRRQNRWWDDANVVALAEIIQIKQASEYHVKSKFKIIQLLKGVSRNRLLKLKTDALGPCGGSQFDIVGAKAGDRNLIFSRNDDLKLQNMITAYSVNSVTSQLLLDALKTGGVSNASN
jgi:hypothetical protein